MAEVMGAVVGITNNHIEQMKLAWEPARYQAYIAWNVGVDRKYKMKAETDMRKFAWETKEVSKDQLDKAMRQIRLNRHIIKNVWKLKYKHVD